MVSARAQVVVAGQHALRCTRFRLDVPWGRRRATTRLATEVGGLSIGRRGHAAVLCGQITAECFPPATASPGGTRRARRGLCRWWISVALTVSSTSSPTPAADLLEFEFSLNAASRLLVPRRHLGAVFFYHMCFEVEECPEYHELALQTFCTVARVVRMREVLLLSDNQR